MLKRVKYTSGHKQLKATTSKIAELEKELALNCEIYIDKSLINKNIIPVSQEKFA